jgi:PAS domain S-box-containing protein
MSKVTGLRPILIGLGIVILYVLLLLFLYPIAGMGVVALSVLPVIIMAWLYERKGGLIACALCAPITIALLAHFGYPGAQIIMQSTTGVPVLVAIALVIGQLRSVSQQLERELVERKRAEEVLENTQARFDLIFEHLPDAVLLIDPFDTSVLWPIVECNDAACQMNGYRRGELLGKSIEILLEHRGDAAEHAAYLAQLREGPLKNESVHRRKDGTTFPISTTTSLIMLEGHELILGIDRDISERKLAETELTALYNATSYLFQADNLLALGQQIVQAVVKEFGQADCGLLLIDKTQDKLVRLARTGSYHVQTGAPLSLHGPGLVPEALRTDKSIYAPDVTADSRYVSNVPETRSELVVPLRTARGLIGVLDLQSTQTDAFDEGDQRVLVAFAERAAAAIETRQLYEEINQYTSELEWRVLKRTAELQRAKEHVEAILSSSSDAIILTYPDGTIQTTNPAFNRLFGYETNEIVGQSLLTLPTLDFLAPLQQALHHVANDSQSQRIEMSAGHKLGTSFDADVMLAPIIGEGDETIGIVCSIRDITERKHVEEALRRSQMQLQSLVDNTDAVIYVKDLEGRYLLGNRQLEKVFHISLQGMQGKTDYDLFPPEMAEAFHANDKVVIASGVSCEFEEIAVQDDGLHTYLTNKFPLVNSSGDVYAVCGISTDITAQKLIETSLRGALEKERELNELKSRFVTMVSHEFRTPLAIIQSAGDLLKHYGDRMTEDKKHDQIDEIHIQVKLLTAFLEDILAISRAASVGVDYKLTPVNLEQLCRDLIVETGLITDKYTLAFSASGECGEVLMDAKLIRKAITNLLLNAVKYSPVGSTIHLGLVSDDVQMTVQVTDTGIGIPKEDQKHLFEAFYRAKNVGNISGTGLGLAIVKHAVDIHGGTVQVESEEDVGTTFTMSLPRLTDLSAATDGDQPRLDAGIKWMGLSL